MTIKPFNLSHVLCKTKTGLFEVGRWFLLLSIICMNLLGVSACGNKKQEGGKTKVVSAEKKIITTNLYYSGVIEPLSFKPVPTPVEGTIKELHFEYGQAVKKDDLLISLYSRQLQDTYRTTLTTYLTAKRTYLDSLTSFEGTKVLHERKIVSDEEFKNEQSRVDSNRLAYVNALYNLEQGLKDVPGERVPEFKENIEKLSFQETTRIEEILDRKMDIIQLYASNDGIALLPKKGESGEGAQDKEISEGQGVKKGENLVSLGDLSSIAILVKVNEIDINRVKVGQKVDVTVPALPGETLKGEIRSISSQARSDARSGGLASFPAKIVVKEMSDRQRKLIRIGMSAKVSVNIQSQPELIIPIEAVFEKDGTDRVIMLDPKTKKEKNVPVVVGKTNPEGISVVSGLKEGDKIVVRD